MRLIISQPGSVTLQGLPRLYWPSDATLVSHAMGSSDNPNWSANFWSHDSVQEDFHFRSYPF